MAIRAAVVCAAIFVSGAAAATSAAATLTVSVKPTTVHRNQTYVITITGRYRHRAEHRTPHLLAFIQYSGSICRRTATAEYRLPTSEWNWLFYPQRAESSSQVKLVLYEQARTKFGTRRICAYLYPTRVTPQATAKPVARAGAEFQEVR